MTTQGDRLHEQTAIEPRAALGPGAPVAVGRGIMRFAVRRHSLEIDSGTVSWLEAGAGIPLILLHGIGSNAESWRPVLGLLAEHFHVFAWDMPGYGESAPLIDPQPDPAPYAAVLAKWLDALMIARGHVLGHSLGALPAAKLAAIRPDLVRSLILVSPALGSAQSPGSPMPAAIEQRITELSTLGAAEFARKRAPNLCADVPKPDALQAIEQAMGQVKMPGYGQACWLLAQGDLAKAVQNINVPGLVIGGSQDKVVPPERARNFAAVWPGSLYREIAGVGHGGYVEDPPAYVAPIQAFLEDNSKRV